MQRRLQQQQVEREEREQQWQSEQQQSAQVRARARVGGEAVSRRQLGHCGLPCGFFHPVAWALHAAFRLHCSVSGSILGW